jgi:molybdenum cofactor biosynthesis enzyme MoaA
VTVSLDALDDETFAANNDVGFPVARVLAGIDAAAAAGLTPLKVNKVVQRGVNDHAIPKMAEYFRGSGHVLRLIEYMDVGTRRTNSSCVKPCELYPASVGCAQLAVRCTCVEEKDGRDGICRLAAPNRGGRLSGGGVWLDRWRGGREVCDTRIPGPVGV